MTQLYRGCDLYFILFGTVVFSILVACPPKNFDTYSFGLLTLIAMSILWIFALGWVAREDSLDTQEYVNRIMLFGVI